MLSACPESWGHSIEETWVRENCTSDSSRNLPPVSDVETGRVYENEYCARCNGIENPLTWRYKLACSASLRQMVNQPEFNLTKDLLERECNPCSFVEPQFDLTLSGNPAQPARACYPHVSSCLEKTELEAVTGNVWDQEMYDQVFDQCVNGPYNLVTTIRTPTMPLRNQYCALCNGINPNKTDLHCYFPPNIGEYCTTIAPHGNQTMILSGPAFNFNLLLDIHRDGQVVVTSEVITTTITVTCDSGEVYDPILRACRATVSINELPEECFGEFIALNESDYQLIGNDTVRFNGATVEVVRWILTNNGSLTQPVICTNFSQNGTTEVNDTILYFNYPIGYFILTYIGCSLSVIGTILILLTYSLFKELRTLPSKIIINVAAAILVSNLVVLVGGPLAFEIEACVAVAILLHYFFVAQFIWMSIACFEIARTLHGATKLKINKSKHFKTKIFIVYLLIGWGIPLAIVLTSIILNFTTDGVILYGVTEDGRKGSCWINDVESVAVAFITPIVATLLFNATQFTYISVLLCKAFRSQAKLNKTKHTPYFRIYISIFSVTGLTWVFGFVSLLARQGWAWYVFIGLNTTQGFIMFVAFLCTKKVAKLYFSLVCKVTRLHSTKQTYLNKSKNRNSSKQQSSIEMKSVKNSAQDNSNVYI